MSLPETSIWEPRASGSTCIGGGFVVDMRVTITFPNGRTVQAETLLTSGDRARGLMFRRELAAGRGVLFCYQRAGLWRHTMHNVSFPIDTVWLSEHCEVVEIVANMPPCPDLPCPTYGGTEVSRYALELPAGTVAANDIVVGSVLSLDGRACT